MPHNHSVGVIITDGKRFLLQQKDITHPIESWRNKFCLFGGGVDGKESVQRAMRREMQEEFKPQHVAMRIVRAAQLLWTFELPMFDEKNYTLTVFVSLMRPDDMDILIKAVAEEEAVQEGRGVLLNEDTVKCLMNQPAVNFVASHDRALAEYFEDNNLHQETEA